MWGENRGKGESRAMLQQIQNRFVGFEELNKLVKYVLSTCCVLQLLKFTNEKLSQFKNDKHLILYLNLFIFLSTSNFILIRCVQNTHMTR